MEKLIVDVPTVYPMTWQYSPAIKVTGGSLLFVSGIVGYTPDQAIARDDIVAQAEQAFKNLELVLQAAGGTLRDIVKVNIYLGEDYGDRADELRALRSRFFTGDYPVSTLVQVAGFASRDYLFEVEAIAALP